MKTRNYYFLKSRLFLLLIFAGYHATAQVNYSDYFNQAYNKYPNLPKGILESISYNTTRIVHILPDMASDVNDDQMPQVCGVMGLYKDGQGHFKNTLELVSRASGYSIDELISSPEKNILGTAAYLNKLGSRLNSGKNLRLEVCTY